MANLKNKRLAILLGRVTTLVVALTVLVAIGLAATCPWLCDTTAMASERCEAAPALAQHHESPAPSSHPRWHAGDKF